MNKDRLEEIIVGLGALVFGIVCIIIGIIINDKMWFTASMIIMGTIFAVYACQYLNQIPSKRNRK